MKLPVLFAALTLIGIGAPYRADAAEEIPLVGCAIETVFGNMPAPVPSWRTTDLPPAFAQKLAFYGTEDDKVPVLAPRGWQCHGTGGSSGNYLYIRPAGEPSDPSPPKGAFVSRSVTSNSGVHGLGTLALERRLRNKHWTPQEDANLVSAFKYYGANFSFADCGTPFPADRLADRGPNIVEFETPPNRRGVGAADACAGEISPLATFGFVEFSKLDETRSMIVRLPGTQSALARDCKGVDPSRRGDPAVRRVERPAI